MKDERNHHCVVDKSFTEQQIRIVDAHYILCEKNWTHSHSEARSYMWQAGGNQVKYRCQNLEILKITVHLKIQLFASFNQGTASLQQ